MEKQLEKKDKMPFLIEGMFITMEKCHEGIFSRYSAPTQRRLCEIERKAAILLEMHVRSVHICTQTFWRDYSAKRLTLYFYLLDLDLLKCILNSTNTSILSRKRNYSF